MVKGELEMARDQASKTEGKPRLLPVRLAYAGTLVQSRPLPHWSSIGKGGSQLAPHQARMVGYSDKAPKLSQLATEIVNDKGH
jgi:hypothetical protein